jgi:hypothetical protein
MGRQTACKDYSNGQYPTMAVVRADNRFRAAHVAERLSAHLVVIERYAEGCPPRTKSTDALLDLAALLSRNGQNPEDPASRLTPFAVAFGWLLLSCGAVQRENSLRLEVDPVRGLVGYIPQLAGEIRFIGDTLFSCDPLAGEETLLDHLRATVALAGAFPDPCWYHFERERIEAGENGALSLLADGGTCYRFFFDTVGGEDQDQRDRLVGILVVLIAQALNHSPQAIERCRGLFRRMWSMSWFTENWQLVHVKTLFGATPSVHYEHHLHECFEAAVMVLREGKK